MNGGKLANWIFAGIAITGIAFIIYHSSLKPRIMQRKLNSDMRVIKNAVEMYHSNSDVFPESLDFLVGVPKTILSDKPIKLSEWKYSVYEDDNSYGYSLTHLNSGYFLIQLNSKL